MQFFEEFGLEVAPAICYSGFRDGQQPGGNVPTYEEIKEDLLLLEPHWRYLRLYDCDQHAQIVLDVISQEQMPFQVMLGAYVEAETNNPDCPWGTGMYEHTQLKKNIQSNNQKIQKLIQWANRYPEIIIALSVGNEACVGWTDHMVPIERISGFVKQVKLAVKQPVTFCENYVPWLKELQPLAAVVDFISIHSYPIWENKPIEEGIGYTRENVESVARLYPNKPVVITEAGWATAANGRGFEPVLANENNQQQYVEELTKWANEEKILCFLFEAFDENWKGSPDPNEPEKHWGVYTANRKPKKFLKELEGRNCGLNVHCGK